MLESAHLCPISSDLALHANLAWSKDRKRSSASWRSGYAADCKSVYTGSIPVLASNLFNNL